MLDDSGEDGMSLVRNINKMYAAGDGHVHILASGFCKLDHLLCCPALRAELANSPAKILKQWAAAGISLPEHSFRYEVDSKGTASADSQGTRPDCFLGEL